MERLSKEQIEAVIQEAKERCPYYGEPDGCNAHGGPLMCCDELDEVGELAKAACALGTVEELSALVKAREEGLIQSMSCAGCRYEKTCSFEEHKANCMRCIRNRYPYDKYDRAEAEAAIGGGGDG